MQNEISLIVEYYDDGDLQYYSVVDAWDDSAVQGNTDAFQAKIEEAKAGEADQVAVFTFDFDDQFIMDHFAQVKPYGTVKLQTTEGKA